MWKNNESVENRKSTGKRRSACNPENEAIPQDMLERVVTDFVNKISAKFDKTASNRKN